MNKALTTGGMALNSDSRGFKIWLAKKTKQHMLKLECELGEKCPVRINHIRTYHDMRNRCSWASSCPLRDRGVVRGG